MQPGEIIANTFAAVPAVCGLAIIFRVAGRPLFLRRQARMVLMMPADLTLHEATKTWVISKKRRMGASGGSASSRRLASRPVRRPWRPFLPGSATSLEIPHLSGSQHVQMIDRAPRKRSAFTYPVVLIV